MEKPNAGQPVIFNPDFFVERLRHEHPQVFTDLVLSNITRLIDLPGDEFAQLTGDCEPKVAAAGGFLRSLNFLKKRGVSRYIAPLELFVIRSFIISFKHLCLYMHTNTTFRLNWSTFLPYVWPCDFFFL